MKIRKYEKTFFIYFLTLVIILCFFIILFFCKFNCIKTYNHVSSTVIKNNLVYCLMSSKELKNVYRNKYLIIDNKKQLIKIENVDKDILKRNSKYYHGITFKVKLSKKYKENDVVEILLFDKKINIFSMIKMVWRR